MAFTSQLYPGEPIYHDGTPLESSESPSGHSKGLKLSLRTTAFGAIPNAQPFPADLLIPRSEWQSRIQEMEERKSRISDISIQAGLPCKDQDGTNYCWINAPVHCVEIVRVVQNQDMVLLSPASCGGPIKDFRNDGGWGEEGLRYIVEHGIVPVSQWPANAIDSHYWTDANRNLALNYRVTEWWECRPRNLDEMVSLLMRRIPGAVGYNWWSHEVTACEPVWLDGTVALRIRNSWGMGWGSQGFGILQGSRMLADDLVAPRVALAA